MIERKKHKKVNNLQEYFLEYDDVVFSTIIVSFCLVGLTILLKVIFPNQPNYPIGDNLFVRDSYLIMFFFVIFGLIIVLIYPLMAINHLTYAKRAKIDIIIYIIMGILVFFRRIFDDLILHLISLDTIFYFNIIVSLIIAISHIILYSYYKEKIANITSKILNDNE
ncbi:MAG: hypothetical protein ACP6IY_03310 [Promethearchaeia archaeon]